MKLANYIEKLNKLLKEKGDLPIIYSMDEEGNGFDLVIHEPTAGVFEENDFTIESESLGKPNVICIN